MTNRSIESIEPADCFQRARLFAAEVELIRREAGRPVETRGAVAVTNASPRECYFQALASFRKADRLCQEAAGDPMASIPHSAPLGDLRPGHVLGVIDAALRELAEVKQALHVTDKAEQPAREAQRTPSDVFGALATANRQLNLLLERPFTPADVFQQVSLAIAYTARLGAEPAAPPAFERAKRPADCYRRLQGCLESARAIARRNKHQVIDSFTAPSEDSVLPSDVFDVATLVLGEVAFLHSHSKDATPLYPFEANMPGRKLPAHVFQLAGVLEKQLQQLAK
nr:hypothetical protein [Kofleriaceae bacterium]